MKAAYVFPGQGSQVVGMGRDLYETFAAARAVFEEADKVLGFPLSRLCFEGPEEELRQTVNAQPALVTVSLACLKAIQSVDHVLPPAALVAGHSLGEYTALVVADVLDASTVIYLARERGRLMHEAGLKRPGGMVAIIGLDETILAEVCRQTGTWIANYNSPGQLVISGARDDLPRAVELAKAKGAARTIPLAVSGAFHTPLMQSAVDGMTKAIANLTFRNPGVPVVANTTGQPLATAAAIKTELLDQLCNAIKWQQSVEYMVAQGVTDFIEIGPGKVLTGLIKRIDKSVATLNISNAEAIKSLNKLS